MPAERRKPFGINLEIEAARSLPRAKRIASRETLRGKNRRADRAGKAGESNRSSSKRLEQPRNSLQNVLSKGEIAWDAKLFQDRCLEFCELLESVDFGFETRDASGSISRDVILPESPGQSVTF
jgi:hypothetical protein